MLDITCNMFLQHAMQLFRVQHSSIARPVLTLKLCLDELMTDQCHGA